MASRFHLVAVTATLLASLPAQYAAAADDKHPALIIISNPTPIAVDPGTVTVETGPAPLDVTGDVYVTGTVAVEPGLDPLEVQLTAPVPYQVNGFAQDFQNASQLGFAVDLDPGTCLRIEHVSGNVSTESGPVPNVELTIVTTLGGTYGQDFIPFGNPVPNIGYVRQSASASTLLYGDTAFSVEAIRDDTGEFDFNSDGFEWSFRATVTGTQIACPME